MSVVDSLPVWAVGLVVLAVLTLASRIGVSLRALTGNASQEDGGYILSAALGLLALLIGFTFSLALNQYEMRRDLVLQEANAIGTTYLRAELAPDPFRSELQTLVRRYVDVRLALADAGEDAAAIARAEAQAALLQRQMWDTTVVAIPHIDPPVAGPLLTAAVNDTIDFAASRKAALAERLPGSVVLALLAYAVISAGILGYVTRGNRRDAQISAFVLFVLVTLAITLVLDLDRPRTGSIVVSQAPLLDLKASLKP
ncbi:hypothetical protein [Acidisphaera sp. S103]|uniref:bestrophin-like domain n=1 Tax=Acidisphaera sp. S103 TaxID=1747223 RepID=UPI00131EB8C8|nr:hypothetical protein [Acidisphaera sp. S103]